MDVGMADAAMSHAHEHFAAFRRRDFPHRFAERNAVVVEYFALHAAHHRSPGAGEFSSTLASALASATNPAMPISSARFVGATPACASNAAGSVPSVRKLARSIFRRWPKAAAVTRSSRV